MPIESGCLAVSQTFTVAQGADSLAAAEAGKTASGEQDNNQSDPHRTEENSPNL